LDLQATFDPAADFHRFAVVNRMDRAWVSNEIALVQDQAFPQVKGQSAGSDPGGGVFKGRVQVIEIPPGE